MSNISYHNVLKQEKQFRRRLLAQTFSRFGDSVDQITFSWLMYSLTNSASLLALSLFFNFLPTILLQPFAGPLAERYKKQKILFLCDAGRALLTVFASVCFLKHILSPGLLIALTLCNSTLEAFQMPASSAALPLLLQDEHLESGISLNAALSRGVEIAGQGAAGLLLGSLGAAGALLIDGGCFVVSAFLCLSLHIPEKQPASAFSLSGYLRELKGGFQMLFSLRRVLLFALTCTAINFLLSPVNAYQSAYISGDLHFGPQMLSAVGVATSLGIMLGSFFGAGGAQAFSRQALSVCHGNCSGGRLPCPVVHTLSSPEPSAGGHSAGGHAAVGFFHRCPQCVDQRHADPVYPRGVYGACPGDHRRLFRRQHPTWRPDMRRARRLHHRSPGASALRRPCAALRLSQPADKKLLKYLTSGVCAI